MKLFDRHDQFGNWILKTDERQQKKWNEKLWETFSGKLEWQEEKLELLLQLCTHFHQSPSSEYSFTMFTSEKIACGEKQQVCPLAANKFFSYSHWYASKNCFVYQVLKGQSFQKLKKNCKKCQEFFARHYTSHSVTYIQR